MTGANGPILGQVAVIGKDQELGAMPDLLALRGALVSLDALSYKSAIAEQILA